MAALTDRKDRMRIAIITNPTSYQWSPLDLDSLRGGEEATVFLARALAKRGHDVTVRYDGPTLGDVVDGVPMIPLYEPRSHGVNGYDVAIFHNVPVDPSLAPQCIAWTYEQSDAIDLSAAAHVVVSSPYMQRVIAARSPITASRVTVIPYGIDPDEFDGDVERDPNRVVFASTPERGLAELLDVWPRVKAARPDAKLHCSYGWDAYLAHGGSPQFAEHATAAMRELDGVTFGRLSRADMNRLYRTAGVWAYYCTGGESFCITGVKAQHAGCVPVVKPWGGLHDTVRSGLLATDKDDFAAKLIEALDPERQAELRAAIPVDVATPWDDVAALWEPLFAAPAAETTSRIHAVPVTPATLKSDPTTANVIPTLHATLNGWVQTAGVQRPVADPSLGVGFPPLTSPPDGIVVGWSLEDADAPPHETISALGIPDGAAVLVLSSTGPWRAGQRRRNLSRRDLVELFGLQPDVTLRCTALGPEGNGIFSTSFRYDESKLGRRDLRRVRTTQAPRETLSVCMIVRDSEAVLLKALESVAPIADEVILIDTGSVDGTADVVARFAAAHPALPLTYEHGTSPRWCYDCLAEHPVGEVYPGHRVAGFETPRNESIARATMDWVLWIDSDETVLHPERIAKYLRPSPFAGFSIPQDHHASDPPNAYKRDLPVRLFRRVVDPQDEPGLQLDDAHRWPTYHTGLTVRFAGIVHEHPGLKPDYANGLGPVMVLGDVWIAHTGYYTEAMRRGRFVRNWPLMVADRQRYPDRRLGLFLWLRDLCHHVRYAREQHGGQMTAEAAALAEEGIQLFRTHFLDTNDMMAGDALGYATVLLESLGRGIEVNCTVQARKPEIGGDDTAQTVIAGRVESEEDLVRLLKPKLGEWERWQGDYA